MVAIGARVVPIDGNMFFNAEAVQKRLDKAKLQKFSQTGAFTRTRARSSIKPAKVLNRKEIRAARKLGRPESKPEYESSKAGEAPRTRRPGDPIKKILFGFDQHGGPDGGGNLVVGFGLAFGQQTGTPLRLEKGGAFRIKKTGRLIRTAARPTLAPALAIEQAKATMLFSGSL